MQKVFPYREGFNCVLSVVFGLVIHLFDEFRLSCHVKGSEQG